MSGFYVLRPWRDQRFGKHFAFADILEPAIFGNPASYGVCPVCGSPLGPRPWLAPQVAALSCARYPDFLWGAGFELAVTERVRAAFQTLALSGVVDFGLPIKITRVGRKRPTEIKEAPPQYHNLQIVHGAATLDDHRSGARRKRINCEHCRQGIQALRRVVLDADSWTGDDIFVALGLPGNILVSERFKQMVDDHGFTGAELIRASEYHFDFDELGSGL